MKPMLAFMLISTFALFAMGEEKQHKDIITPAHSSQRVQILLKMRGLLPVNYGPSSLSKLRLIISFLWE